MRKSKPLRLYVGQKNTHPTKPRKQWASPNSRVPGKSQNFKSEADETKTKRCTQSAPHLTWVGINSAVHIHSIEKEADTQKLGNFIWRKKVEPQSIWLLVSARSPAYHGDHHHWHLVNVFPPREESMKKLLKVKNHQAKLIIVRKKSPGKEAVDEEEESSEAVEANVREAPTHPGLRNWR